MAKALPTWEVVEQGTVADILKSTKIGGKDGGTLMAPSDDEVQKMLDAEAEPLSASSKTRAASKAIKNTSLRCWMDKRSSYSPGGLSEGWPGSRAFKRHEACERSDQGNIDHLDMLKSKLG